MSDGPDIPAPLLDENSGLAIPSTPQGQLLHDLHLPPFDDRYHDRPPGL